VSAPTTRPVAVAVRGLIFDVHLAGPDDGAPVLLLHGFPQHSGLWAEVAPLLHEAGLRTIALDQRGYSPGARPAADDAYRISECAADALAVLDELVGDRPVDVVGHDWGAVVGWHLAAGHPDRVRTLSALSVPHPAAMLAAVRADPEQRERSAYMLLFAQVSKAEEVLLADDAAALRAVFAGSGLDEAGVQRYVAPLREPGALAGALRWYAAARIEPPAELGPVRVPATFVWGREDVAVGWTAAKACGEYVAADYAFVALDASHWLPDQVPAAVAKAALGRIRRDDDPAA
jgi:pimeloyl-ACP methyl ester carboxylesterase